ncbi:hypothetical protein C2S52_020231 [Perilla frutescens var. hirtella]|nr:hypothetical protein C2S52_020231 [Perilla frutescens var. hirtella]KAH6805580.1 hypothetical protein C2S51_030411 [Perilla frutescens var. frutescens]
MMKIGYFSVGKLHCKIGKAAYIRCGWLCYLPDRLCGHCNTCPPPRIEGYPFCQRNLVSRNSAWVSYLHLLGCGSCGLSYVLVCASLWSDIHGRVYLNLFSYRLSHGYDCQSTCNCFEAVIFRIKPVCILLALAFYSLASWLLSAAAGKQVISLIFGISDDKLPIDCLHVQLIVKLSHYKKNRIFLRTRAAGIDPKSAGIG